MIDRWPDIKTHLTKFKRASARFSIVLGIFWIQGCNGGSSLEKLVEGSPSPFPLGNTVIVGGGGSITCTNPDKIQIFSGTAQTASVNTALANPMVAIVRDSAGTPCSGVSVAFTALAGGGTIVTGQPVLTDAIGMATSTVALGPTAGTHTFRAAMASGSTRQVTFISTATAGSGAPDKIEVSSGSGQVGAVSSALLNPLTVRVKDSAGNPLSGVTVTFAVNAGGGSVADATAQTDSAGFASTTVALGSTVGTQTYSASIASGTITSVTFSETATASIGAPSSLSVISGGGQSAVIGNILSSPVVIKVLDSSGNGVPNTSVTVIFDSGVGSGTVITGQPLVTDASGNIQVSLQVGNTIGLYTFRAKLTSDATKYVGIVSTATEQPSFLKIWKVGLTGSVGNTSMTVGDPLNMRAVLVDGNGNYLRDVAATWWLTGSLRQQDFVIGSGAGNPNAQSVLTPGTIGSGTVNAMINDSSLISQYNIAGTSTVTGTISAALAIVPDAISIISGNHQTAQVGSNLPTLLKVKVVNGSNVAVPGTNVTFAVTAGGGQIITAQPITTDASGYAETQVRLGGQLGASHTFTATSTAGSVTQVVFTATGTVGPASQLSFATQPSGANAGTVFTTQPVVEIRDSYGNRVTSDSSTQVTIAVQTGAGTLSGTKTVTASSGLATFTDLNYSLGETGVVLRATSSPAYTATNSSAFAVGTIIAAAQCAGTAGAGWSTREGGCKDGTSGLIWSAISSTTMTWADLVWDSAVSGASSPEATDILRGLTKDWDGSVADTNGAAYCHSLVESGLDDWRAPTYAELSTAMANGAGTGPALKDSATYIWHATGSTNVWVRLSDGNNLSRALSVAASVRCVRQATPTKLLWVSQPSAATKGFGVNVPFETQPVVRLADSGNSTSTFASDVVKLSHDGTGQFCTFVPTTGALINCAATATKAASNGIATFSNLVYTKAETITITASPDAVGSALSPVAASPITVNQNYPFAQCKTISGGFINAKGGCKDTGTGAIFSSTALTGISWYDAIWDNVNPAANIGTQDSEDAGRTNDYDTALLPTSGNFDNSSVNYCHTLQESGYSDWMVPRYTWMVGKNLATPTNLYLTYGPMVTSGSSGAANFFYIDNLSSGSSSTSRSKIAASSVTCVRFDDPASLAFATEPADSNGLGAGVIWPTQPTIVVRDADGAGPLSYVNGTIRLQVIPTSGGTGGTGELLTMNTTGAVTSRGTYSDVATPAGNYIDVPFTGGTVSLSSLAYSKKNEGFRLRATATVTYKGQSIDLSSATTSDLSTSTVYALAACNAVAGWATQYGGCRDQGAGGLVWSLPLAYNVSWNQAIWDSAITGSAAQDGYDSAANDYDNSPGANPDAGGQGLCHELEYGGYRDWRMATQAETQAMVSRSGLTGLKGWSFNSHLWTSTTVTGTPANAVTFSVTASAITASGIGLAKTSTNGASAVPLTVRCVRSATP